MEIEVLRKFCLLFHLPCLCADFQGYFTMKLLFFFFLHLHFSFKCYLF